ncbi:uncharacterized protein LOC116340740 isoform X2 [Contarinia nasturtii]|uniref:uncharacterized protein LOC116340740 isoform X2 n=1 Tax=Contarinia nasturtii TaxID=265458 RepID=UPI0012D3D6F9|nr:uncharacterized protein LOC116340740 isoform X2 [Contarinia nasturtii]
MSLFPRSFCRLKIVFSTSKPVYISRNFSFTVNGYIKRFSGQKYVHKFDGSSNQHRNITTVNSKMLTVPSGLNPEIQNKFNQLEYLICLDFEATCWTPRDLYRAEIIEFGAVLINLKNKEILSEFHEYVQPTNIPILSDYCMDLTGITQEMIDDKEHFPVIFRKFESWLESIRELNQLNYTRPNKSGVQLDWNTTFCSWTNYDLGHYFRLECERHNITHQDYFNVWIDAKRYFRMRHKGHYTFEMALIKLNISPVGRAHSAIVDAKTLAQMVFTLFQNNTILFQVRKAHNNVGDCIVLFQQKSNSEPTLLTAQSDKEIRNQFDYLICLDFEETRWETRTPGRSEIIEFGAVLLNLKNGQIMSEFHDYVRPIENPNLSEFCTRLTNISQQLIDEKDCFPTVYQRFDAWLKMQCNLKQLKLATPDERYAQNGCNATFCSWTSWDLGFLFRLDCARHNIEQNEHFSAWIDVRKKVQRQFLDQYTFAEAMRFLNVPQTGNKHSAIDDARTLADMVAALYKNDVQFYKATDIRLASFDQ